MAVARVIFTLPLPEPFDYAIPEGEYVVRGSIVRAPLGPMERLGVVWDVAETSVHGDNLKPLAYVYRHPPLSGPLLDFIDFAGRYSVVLPGGFLRMVLRSPAALEPGKSLDLITRVGEPPAKLTPARERVLDAANTGLPARASELAKQAGVSASVVKGLVDVGALVAETCPVDPPYTSPGALRRPYPLSDDQRSAYEALKPEIARQAFSVTLVDGVTGSGKTDVYLEAIAQVFEQAPEVQCLVLLPEIALTEAILERFKQRFGAEPVAWHSGISDAERRRAWREVAHGRARLVIGARSALFLPFPNLRLIVVDEEHDGSYKQEDGVIYHARNFAVARAKFEDCPIVLGSATPALETLHNAQSGRYHYLKLAARPGTSRLPDVDLIDMREHPPEKGEWLSPPLKEALASNYADGEQSLLFINRRGYAPLVICKACGEKLKTPGTESWLTEHRYTGRLVCHLTGFSMKRPDQCPKCGARDSLTGVGPGIERIGEEVRRSFPQAKAEILSSDMVQTSDMLTGVLDRMANGDIDILIGTQLVAKGHNFPGLTLVGVVDADASLKGGDLRAGERTYQLLSQVAGRAGRAEKPGRALLQTYQPEAPLMQALAASDRDQFLMAESEMREVMGFPPFGRLAALIYSDTKEDEASKFAKEIGACAPAADGIDVWGPAPAPIGVLRGWFRWRFLVRADPGKDLSAYMDAWVRAIKKPSRSRLQVDIDPYSFL